MIVYHEVTPSSLTSTLRHGLKRTTRGAKGDDSYIKKTDLLLDTHRSTKLQHLGVSRCNNVYAYLGTPTKITGITNGKTQKLSDFVKHSNQALLCLEVDPSKCFVSNLDLYDTVLNALRYNQSSAELEKLAHNYWNNLAPLTSYKSGSMPRPEVLITYDVPSSHITVMYEGEPNT